MLTLIHKPQTRSGSIVWLLEELGVPYETRAVTLKAADGSGARDPSNPHPHGKVPALIDDGQVIFESGAIALYLTDKFPAARMGPLPGEPKRGEYLSWLFYRPGVMEPAFLERRFAIPHVYGAMGWGTPGEVEQVINDHLAKNRWFLGEDFSAADILVGGGVFYMTKFGMMTETDVVKDYCARLAARPAFAKMMA
ncbi:MAG: glutathione S-transferase family protein [Alphaproteobacteria bacterium]|nr:glutathione S-transferase family protein [Alphaproteobacteria bacterium]